MKIRTVTPNDINACYAIEESCFEPSEAATKAKIELRARLFPDGFIVGELDKRIIGMVNSGATNKDDISDEALKAMSGHSNDGKNLVIFSMAVAPGFQGKGYSRPLMENFCERAKVQGREKILLICKDHLIPYYEHFGFRDVGKSASTHGGFAWHEMIFEIQK